MAALMNERRSFADELKKVIELRELTRIEAARSGRAAFFRDYPWS
jgi:hypothetical protein